MTDSINTSQNNQSSERPDAKNPRADAHRSTSPASDVTEPVPAVPVAPPGLESVTGEPGYATRQASDSETPGTTDRSRSGQSGAGQSTTSPSGSNQGSSNQGKSDQAKGAAQDVAGDAKDAGRAVKDTAAQEAAGVKDDAVREAKRLGGEAGTMLESQASEQLDRAAGTVRTFSDDVARIARGEKPEPGVAKDLLDQVNSRAEATATWLEGHDPKEVLQEVQSFARRRPVAFLAIAAGVGFAAGRVTRGLKQHHADDDRQGSSTSSQGASTSTPGTSAGAASGPAGGTSSGAASGPVPGTIPTGSTDSSAGGGGR
ncbi:hypothetical protein [Nesterenkonia sp. CF4.4]|uniref:hypothetical protein n=1 Tax=Nesterenkonia sp. CF4.4 TaxID=3373079 RepID=UPI003EE75EFC